MEKEFLSHQAAISAGNNGLLLIEPPFYRLYKDTYSLTRLPLSLGYLAGAALKNSNWRVLIFNSDFYPEESPVDLRHLMGEGFSEWLRQIEQPSGPVWDNIASTIKEFRPKIVGITSKSANFASACIVAEIVKSIYPDTMVVVGGPHATMVREGVLQKSQHIDVGVFGEGEQTLLELMQVSDGEKTIDSVEGIVYRGASGIIQTPPRQFIAELDSLGFPVLAAKQCLKDYELYPARAFENIFASRGCPNRCTFCGSHKIWGRKPRFRSIDNVIQEITEIISIGCTSINFDDDTFGCKKSLIRELCSALTANFPKLKWSCEIHVNLVDPEIIATMQKAGCYRIMLGVESGNNEVLKSVKKGYTIEQAFEAAKIITDSGIMLGAFFMVGFPNETVETLNDTIQAITDVPSNLVIFSTFTPYPGTELFQHCLEQGIVTEDFDVSRFNHQSPQNYFCPNIPKAVFRQTVHDLAIKIDKINRRKKIRRAFSREGLLNVQQLGVRGVLSKLCKIIMQ